MPEQRRRSPARLLAPLALVLCAIAVFAVLSGSDVEGDGNGADQATESTEQTTTPDVGSEQPRPRRRRTYTVKTGDTLGAIAETTGVDVETIQELNPELDPQALVSGQKITLRE